MKHFRRITALLASILLLHLTVGGAGLLHAMGSCQAQPAPEWDVEAQSSEMEMKMDMPQSAAPDEAGGRVPGGTEDCEGPASHTGCPSAAPCPTSPLLSGGNASFVPLYLFARFTGLYVPVPPFRTTPPDLPPPRA